MSANVDDRSNENIQCFTLLDQLPTKSKIDSICDPPKLSSSSARSLNEDELVPAVDDVSVESSSADDSNASLGNDTDSDSEGECPQDLDADEKTPTRQTSFAALRFSYLLVTLVIMLADGLQGTHLYVLYESYGYSVASLYCIGFMTGGIMSLITGPLVDKIGRKKSAMLYCALEVFINSLEQYPYLSGLIVSRMIGGFTTNLLHSVFETWLDTEYRKNGFAKEKYEILMRDSIIVSNLSAIVSGYLSHVLADHYGAVGPFRGAVACTSIALVVVAAAWTENYGNQEGEEPKGIIEFLREATEAFKNDRKMLRIGIIQGLSSGCLQIFVFLWAPMLISLARTAPEGTWGLDSNGEPAFGLIFGAFMAAGVLGGLAAPPIRKVVSIILSPKCEAQNDAIITEIEGEGEVAIRPMAVEFLAACCYLVGAMTFLAPCLFSNETAFSRVLAAFLIYEFTVGVFFPCQGVIRSLYFPESARASIMAFPAVIVNLAVSIGVISTNFISVTAAFSGISIVMVTSAILQLSLISMREWSSLFSRFDDSSRYARHARRASLSALNSLRSSVEGVTRSTSMRELRRLSEPEKRTSSSTAAAAAAAAVASLIEHVKED